MKKRLFVFVFSTFTIFASAQIKKTLSWDDGIITKSQLDSSGNVLSTQFTTTVSAPKYINNQIIIGTVEKSIYSLDSKSRVMKIQQFYDEKEHAVGLLRYNDEGYIISYKKIINGNFLLNEYIFEYCDGNLCGLLTKEFRKDGTFFGTRSRLEYSDKINLDCLDLALNYFLINSVVRPSYEGQSKNPFAPSILATPLFGRTSKNLLKSISMEVLDPTAKYFQTFSFSSDLDTLTNTFKIKIDNQVGKSANVNYSNVILKYENL
ncbi:hypothetical protein [Pedobacter sp. FW305-3-2-15-E-R2A2]|uniref:hypothetical protein n=1 Tax=Pedobacter sp. FW305-3-2-15-E-R2A2 TaxID=3140251 RepID=UPI0031407C86